MKRWFGLAILIAVVGGTYLWKSGALGLNPGKSLEVRGFLGGEKSGLMKDPEILDRLARLGIRANLTKSGSIEMVLERDHSGMDLLWPSNQIGAELLKREGRSLTAEELIFNSPLVFYTWEEVAAPLKSEGWVEERQGVLYFSNLQGLVTWIEQEKTWADLGLPQLYGKVQIHATDPASSNSGNMFAALLATVMNDGRVVSDADLEAILPRLSDYYKRMGYLENSSSDLFESFLNTGVGAHPIIVGYENQLIEFLLENPNFRDLIRKKVRIIYPQPTFWSSHPVLGLTAGGKQFAEAMKDSQIQELAWQRHGFRSALRNDIPRVAALEGLGIPATIQSVAPLPPASAMLRLIEVLKNP
ncbi:MAG: substrate-binding domain-containing protein [Acidobacteria bacterium]|nr:substrate-binding domain-containing protein [Acidobacteriota bacterium]MCB9398485.1 substrate-binding domain-containing protein [Acidobacteriota bacterium]